MKTTIIAALLIIVTLFFTSFSFAKSSTQSTQIDYELPYPGILPDSPLYYLKTLRDKVASFFISDPIKKAEFDLQAADKRLGAGVVLFDKGKKELAESTISKGENYFEDAIKNLEFSKTQGRVVDPALLTDMELSGRKHVEVLQGMVEKTDGDLKARFLDDFSRATKFVDKVMEFKPEQ